MYIYSDLDINILKDDISCKDCFSRDFIRELVASIFSFMTFPNIRLVSMQL